MSTVYIGNAGQKRFRYNANVHHFFSFNHEPINVTICDTDVFNNDAKFIEL